MYETAKQTLMYRTVLWTLWERERVGRFGRMAFNLFLTVLGLHCYASFSPDAVCVLLVAVAYFVERRLWVHGLPQSQFPGSRAQAQPLWHTHSVAPWRAGSS